VKTIIYNADTSKILVYFPHAYTIDGVEQKLQHPYYQLEIIDTKKPDFDPEKQIVSFVYKADLDAGQYRQTWLIADIIPPSPEEYNVKMKELRALAFKEEADPLAFAFLREEIEKSVWLNKVAEIRTRFAYKPLSPI
jgi:hypothetical protein